ncbi:hypothetical protein niasHS_016315 [Heterodera schachtii]|uniref:MATH domain-containing protein n=1 Tax=Heterodera schachtii TaxID=97005 RepID=A0ABD2I363_HETSC
MFRYDKGQIEITDIEIGVFKMMLTFIYTMRLNELDANNWLDILEAADKYNIIGLVKKCADFPIEKLPSVFVALEKALLLNIELRSSEIEIWNAALHWADEQCRQKGIECSAKNHREMIGPALSNIRFPLIPKRDFTKSIVSTGVLTTEEVISIYQHYSHPNLSDAPGLFALKFPTHRRYKNGEIINMEIEKVSEFAREKVKSHRFSDAVDIGGMPWKIMELLDPSKGFYDKDEDKVKLEIDVIVDEPKTEKIISDPNKSNGTLSMEIEELSEFAREINKSERRSETAEYIRGMPWKIWAQIEGSTKKMLGFYLLCDASEKYGNWKRKCSATLRIVSQKSDVRDFKKELDEQRFSNYSLYHGSYYFISFAELMDPSKGLYNKDEDKVTLAIDFACE